MLCHQALLDRKLTEQVRSSSTACKQMLISKQRGYRSVLFCFVSVFSCLSLHKPGLKKLHLQMGIIFIYIHSYSCICFCLIHKMYIRWKKMWGAERNGITAVCLYVCLLDVSFEGYVIGHMEKQSAELDFLDADCVIIDCTIAYILHQLQTKTCKDSSAAEDQ